MLDLLIQSEPSRPDELRAALAAYVAALSHRRRGDRGIVARVEAEVRADPGRCIRFDGDGNATLVTSERTFAGGRFETPTLGALRERARLARRDAGTTGTLRLFVLGGASAATDIGGLQATAPPASMFQVASQFNCLESPDPIVVDVADYLTDPTQGPRAAVSAFPGTLVRHYAAPGAGGTRFVQRSDGPQLDLLAAVCASGAASVSSGYLLTDRITRPADFARELEDRFDDIQIGIHDDIEVALGHDWDGEVLGARTIAHALCSAIATGGYSSVALDGVVLARIIGALQRAAHLGTLLAAAGLGKSALVLTLVGGGVFGNPVPVIWESMLWAIDAVRPLLWRDLTVVINGRHLPERVVQKMLVAAAQERGGTFVSFNHTDVYVA